ncbi:hypothetical protein [Undibacter mobilis]|nr:hypothetical protein [Undibacter mobilis]
MQASVVDQCVRLAFAIVLIALVSLTLYQFAGGASAYVPESPVVGIGK